MSDLPDPVSTQSDEAAISLATTVVADVGARYGVHPSWREFQGHLRYLAFEPDAEEAERLRGQMRSTDGISAEVFEVALDSRDGERDFRLTKHRGLSSFLAPDLDSECFRHLKPGQAEVERLIRVRTRRLDSLLVERDVVPEFLKVDTEGTEQDVIEGAEGLLGHGVLGIRCSCNFQPCFVGQRLFSETHTYLLERDFVLLNLDYNGFGYPRLGLFRKPDPIAAEDFRYGMLVAADGVWIRRPDRVADTLGAAGSDAAVASVVKLAYFCLLNHAPDVGIDLLRRQAATDGFGAAVASTRLFRALQLRVAQFLGRWRTVPDEQWERMRGFYRDIYDDDLKGGSAFYPQVQDMAAALAET